MIKQIINI